jgi:hypothetical protein
MNFKENKEQFEYNYFSKRSIIFSISFLFIFSKSPRINLRTEISLSISFCVLTFKRLKIGTGGAQALYSMLKKKYQNY